MSAAQVPEWVRIFEAIIIGLGLGTFLWGGVALVLAGIGCAVALTVSTIRNRDRALRLFEEIEKSKARRAATWNGEKVDE